jgi:hypothetical protein
MLEYLAYALFAIIMVVCLVYVMRSLETEERPPDRSR